MAWWFAARFQRAIDQGVPDPGGASCARWPCAIMHCTCGAKGKAIKSPFAVTARRKPSFAGSSPPRLLKSRDRSSYSPRPATLRGRSTLSGENPAMADARPAQPNTDRNLLIGILVLHMDFISKDALVQGMHAWVLEKHKPLAQILVEQGTLAAGARALLEPLVQKHVELHGHDEAQSLAASSSVVSIGELLRQIVDSELQTSLSTVGLARPGDHPTGLPGPANFRQLPGLRFRVLRPHAKVGRRHADMAAGLALGQIEGYAVGQHRAEACPRQPATRQ